MAYDLTEAFQFAELCAQLGAKILNLSAGSPSYNPHIQRPAAYPPSDGYHPPKDPLVGVARQINVVRQVKAKAPKNLVLVGSAAVISRNICRTLRSMSSTMAGRIG